MAGTREAGTTGRKRATRPSTTSSPDGAPPHNVDAERAVLGSILRDNKYLSDIVKILEVDHFYVANNQAIYQAMLKMSEAGKPIDVYTLAEELQRTEKLMEVGGAPALLGLFDGVLTAANCEHYAQIIKEKGLQRSLIHAANEILRDCYDATKTTEELLGQAEHRVFDILDNRASGDAVGISVILRDVFTRISERQNREGSAHNGVPTRFDDLDEMTNGWQNSELIVLAARPSVGKTAFALNIVDYASVDCNMATLFVSLEMSRLEIAERLLCLRSQVNSHSLRKGRVNQDDMSKLIHGSGELSAAPLYIDDTPGLTMMRIAATARRLKLRADLKLVIIDYLQLIEPDDKVVSRVEQISTISRRLKTLARELKIPVISLSQLNRGVESREGHRPRMSDLRESGSIEQDADVVALLHRDDAYDPQDNPGVADLIIAKQRNGPVGDIKLSFRKELTRFENFRAEIAAFGDVQNF